MGRAAVAICLVIMLVLPGAAQARDVTIATLEFPPYVSESMPGKGWAWEVAETALRRVGHRPNLIIVPWARAVSMVRTGRADALYLANDTPERRTWAVFSEPVGEELSVIFRQRGAPVNFRSLEDLGRYAVAGLRGAHVVRKMTEAGVTVQTVNDISQGFRMLLQGRIAAFVTDRYVGQYLLDRQFSREAAEDIEHIGRPVDANQLHLAVSKAVPDHAALLSDFDAGLREIRADGTYAAILRRHGFE